MPLQNASRTAAATLLSGLLALTACAQQGLQGALDTGPAPGNDAALPIEAGPEAAPDVQDPSQPVSIDTTGPASIRSGEVAGIQCVLRNRAGETVPVPLGMTPTITVAPDTVLVRRGMQFVGGRSGDATAACSLPAIGLVDTTPVRIHVEPGAPASVSTTVATAMPRAGVADAVTCAVADAAGNPVTPATAPRIDVTPTGAGADVSGGNVTFTQLGAFMVTCRLDGATSTGVAVNVSPGLPAQLRLARAPDQGVYQVGQEAEVERVILDRFGNVIPDAHATVTAAPATGGAADAGDGRYRFTADGTYTMTATVDGPTDMDMPISGSVQFLVNTNGPSIRCLAPLDGSMVNAAPGSTVTFRGSATDPYGLQSVRVNGSTVTLNSDGSFQTPLTARFGVNFLEVAATNMNGVENTRLCAFLASGSWNTESGLLPSGVSLLLTQPAFDDGAPRSPITSLNDLLETVLNSAGLHDQLDSALLAANPIKPSSCDQEVLGLCVFRSEIRYVASQFNGPNTTSLTLVDGGLRARITLRNVRLRLQISGTIDNTGWLNFSSLDVDLIFDIGSNGGRPTLGVRPGSVSTNVGSISADFSGISGFLIDIVLSLAQGTVRNLVSNTLRDYVTNNLGSTLDGLVGGLDVSTLAQRFTIPRLDRMGSVTVNFGLGLTSVNAAPQRLNFALGTRFTGTTVRATRSLGIALPPPPAAAEPTLNTPATVAIKIGLINQLLHTLWRAGFFDTTIAGLSLGSDTRANATLQLGLPPVASIRPQDGRVILDLGAASLQLDVPALSATPLRLLIGARTTTTMTLMGSDLRFGGLTVEELHLAFDGISASASARAELEMFLGGIVQRLVDTSLNDALPSLPIPGFAIPDSLVTYGLPRGGELGITSPVFGTDPPSRLVLRGGFGIR